MFALLAAFTFDVFALLAAFAFDVFALLAAMLLFVLLLAFVLFVLSLVDSSSCVPAMAILTELACPLYFFAVYAAVSLYACL